MKSFSKSRFLLSVLALGASSSLMCFAHGAEKKAPCPAVDLSESDSGSSCVMVFARVGERFRYDLSATGEPSETDCVVGRNAVGEASTLPAGLAFNRDLAVLEGVPQRSGFHEFVVLRTVEGTTREQVVLIDIQGHSFGAGSADYASYFAGGVQ